MDGIVAKAQSKSSPGLPLLKRPLDLPELLNTAKLPNLGHSSTTVSTGWSPNAGIGPLGRGAVGGGLIGMTGQLGGSMLGGTALGGPTAGGVVIGPAIGPSLPSAPGFGGCSGLSNPKSGSPAMSVGALGPASLGVLPVSGQATLGNQLTAMSGGGVGMPGVVGGGMAAPMGGQQNISIEIPQDKVPLVLGAQGATIKAIKAISGASCFIQQSMQLSDKALLTMSGMPAQIEKCRGLVMALVDGAGASGKAGVGHSDVTMAATVSGLSTLPNLSSLPGLTNLARPPTLNHTPLPLSPNVGQNLTAATLKGLPGTSALGSATLPNAGAGSLASLMGVGGGIDVNKLAGLAGATGNSLGSLSSLLSGVLSSGAGAGGPTSSLYTQLLTAATHLVSTQQGDGSTDSDRKEKPQAFDREALRRLAKQAQENQEAQATAEVSTCGDPSQLAGSSSQALGGLLSLPLPVAPGLDTTGMQGIMRETALEQPPSEVAADAVAPAPAPAPEVSEGTKKDSSSVLGILQQAQDNAARGRVGGARGGTAGSMPPRTDSSAGSSGGSMPAIAVGPVGQWEALNARLHAASASTENRRAVEKEVLSILPKLESRRTAELVVRVHDIECLRSEELLDDIAKTLTLLVPRFGSPDLTRITGTLATWALETMDDADENKLRLSEELRAFFASVATEVSLRLMDVAPGDLARISTSLASLGLGGARLFASIARAAVARSDRFAPHELVSLVVAFDQARYYQTSLLEALARCLKSNIKEVAPKDVIRGMRLLAMCGVQDRELGQVIGEHMPKKALSGGLSAEEFCTLAWTFCALDLHHDRLFRAVFRALEDAAVVASETLCQLYEIHLTLKAFHQDSYSAYELEDDTVQSLRDHYRKHKGGSGRTTKLERSSERVHADVADILREVIDASISTVHQMSLGFTVDVAATKRRSASSSPYIFIEIDGPHSLVRSLDPMDAVGVAHTSRVRGASALKRRVLQKHGFRMGVINEDEWRTMSKSREKREFLREILVKAGVSEDRLL